MSIFSRGLGTQGTSPGTLDAHGPGVYNGTSHLKLLRGWVKFPTGGESPRTEPKAQPIRCDSGADSTVWMREETVQHLLCFT